MERGYGQYCPIAKGAEVFAERWTPLIVRNLHVGADTFTEIAAGCPRISTTLLTQRLKALERAGIIESRPAPRGKGRRYGLTASGVELAEVTMQLGRWGARWLELSQDDYDPYFVLWAWKMNVVLDRLPQPRVVVRFRFDDRPRETFWLLLQRPEAEVCVKPPGYEEDILIETDSRTLTLVHAGRLPVGQAIHEGRWRAAGPSSLVRAMPSWGGFYSSFAGVSRPDPGPQGEGR